MVFDRLKMTQRLNYRERSRRLKIKLSSLTDESHCEKVTRVTIALRTIDALSAKEKTVREQAQSSKSSIGFRTKKKQAFEQVFTSSI